MGLIHFGPNIEKTHCRIMGQLVKGPNPRVPRQIAHVDPKAFRVTLCTPTIQISTAQEDSSRLSSVLGSKVPPQSSNDNLHANQPTSTTFAHVVGSVPKYKCIYQFQLFGLKPQACEWETCSGQEEILTEPDRPAFLSVQAGGHRQRVSRGCPGNVERVAQTECPAFTSCRAKPHRPPLPHDSSFRDRANSFSYF